MKRIDDWIMEWLLFKPIGAIAPYMRTSYSCDGTTVTVKPPFRHGCSVRIDDLDEIGLETTNQGPIVEDVFLILKKADLRIRIGDPHPIFRELMDHFGSLPGFDWKPFAEAMSCSDNRYFVCWRRENK